jgi:hypothetical protein
MKTFPLASLLLVVFLSTHALGAADEPASWPTHSFRLLDAATDAPIAGAKAIVFATMAPVRGRERPYHASINLQRDPLQGRFVPPRSPLEIGPPVPGRPLPISDAEGRVTLAVPAQAATLLVMNERGIAYVPAGQWDQPGGDVRVSLQAWASLSGTVTYRGKAAAGVVLEFARSMASASIGSMFDMYTPPVCHGIAVRTDQDGRFQIERLLPTTIDGPHEVSYQIGQDIGAGPALKVEEMAPSGWMFSLSITGAALPWSLVMGCGELAFAPGEHRDFELAATPPCERTVSGRLIWTDGQPVHLADFKEPGALMEPKLQFLPQNFRSSAGTFPGSDLDAGGRFKVSFPIAGKWHLQTGRVHPLGSTSFGFEFSLPDTADASGKAAPVDLGDIVFQKPGQPVAAPPKPDEHGEVEVVFTVLDDLRRPLPEATVKVYHLDSNKESGSRYLYSKHFPTAQTDAAGLARIKLPVTFRDDEGKDWPISGADLELSRQGCEPLHHTFVFGEQGAVLALKTAASISARVEKEGHALPVAKVVMRIGWVHGADCFEHREWQDAGDGVLRRDRVPAGTWQLQAGHLDAENWRWFSEIVEVPAPGQKAPATLTLRRGTRVTGTLGAEVPRPIQSGMVRVVVRTPPPSDPAGLPIFWSDWQKTDKNGAFVFRGLPPGDAWIAAACAGWISAPARTRPKHLPGDQNWAEPISLHWTAVPFHVDAVETSVTVPMIRAGSVVFHFKNADGTPVAGARPYIDAHITLGPASETLERTERALDQMLGDPDENGYRSTDFLPRPPHELDATGTVRLENLPPTRLRIGLQANRQHFSPVDPTVIPSDHPLDRYAPFQADIKPGEVIEKEFVVTVKE